MLESLKRLLRHSWLDAADTRRAVPIHVRDRLAQRVAASERAHTGQIRIYVEASLPGIELWRHVRRGIPVHELIRARAVDTFARLHVWDTAHNNGVLIYLLLAEHAIEVVADRGLNPHIDAASWDAMTQRLASALRAGEIEQGLNRALDEVSTLLETHFPADRSPTSAVRPNDLPDEPVLG